MEFIKKEWKWLLSFLLIVGVLSFGYYEYKQHKPLPTTIIQKVDKAEIEAALKNVNSIADPQIITERIIETKQAAPQVVYVSQNEKQADKKANDLAKQSSFDYVIKEPVNEKLNNYYAVREERNNKLYGGFTIVDKKAYGSIAWQHKKDEFTLHLQPDGKDSIKGVTYMRRLAEWK